MPRAVNVVHPEGCHLKTKVEIDPARSGVHVALGRELRDPVVGGRLARMCFRDRQNFGLPVICHRAGIEKARHLVLQTKLKRVDRSLNIGVEVSHRVRERPDDRHLPGDVADGIHAGFKPAFELLQIGYIAPDEGGASRNILTLPRRLIVDHQDPVAGSKKPLGQVRANEACSSGNKNPHDSDRSPPGRRAWLPTARITASPGLWEEFENSLMSIIEWLVLSPRCRAFLGRRQSAGIPPPGPVVGTAPAKHPGGTH